MKKTKIILSLITALTLTTNLHAKESDKSFGQIYTDCGLGGLLTAPIPEGVAHDILAVVSNIVWDLGTTAISSNVSSVDTCASGKKEKVAAFINSSYQELEKDLAKGEGIYLDTLASMAKSDSIDSNSYKTKLRSEFSNIVSSNEYEKMNQLQKSESLYNIVF
jgi:hypothetical protein